MVSCLIAGLWPFNFAPRNGARLNGSGLEFSSRGIAYTCAERPLFPSGGFAAGLHILPHRASFTGTGELISFHDADGLLLGVYQWKNSVIVRTGRKNNETGARSVFRLGKSAMVTVSAGKEGIRIYVDEKQVARTSKPFFGIDKAACLTLGNSPDGMRPWKGVVYSLWLKDSMPSDGFAMAGRETGLLASYRFDGAGPVVKNSALEGLDLQVPERFRIAKRVFLQPLFDMAAIKFYAADVVVNFLGFIPVGLLCFYLPFTSRVWVKACIAVFSGFLLSLGIEVTQAFIPGRFSQLSDLLLNTFGAASGAVAAVYLRRFFSSIR